MSPLPHLPPSFLAALPPPALGLDFDPRPSPLLARLQALVLPTPRSYVRADGAVAPDHWLDPSDVWEVKCVIVSNMIFFQEISQFKFPKLAASLLKLQLATMRFSQCSS